MTDAEVDRYEPYRPEFRRINLPAAAREAEATETAQRFLDSAHYTVESALETMEMSRWIRRVVAEGGDARGRLAESEEDMLRAAIVFATAGLDATLKQLVRDALIPIAHQNPAAADQFRRFARRFIRGTDDISVDPKAVADILISDSESPRQALLELYLEELTGGSLQSVEEVFRVIGAFGLELPDLQATIRTGHLSDVFEARNNIVHELDLQSPERPGERRKKTRRLDETVEWVTEILTVAQEITNAVAVQLTEDE